MNCIFLLYIHIEICIRIETNTTMIRNHYLTIIDKRHRSSKIDMLRNKETFGKNNSSQASSIILYSRLISKRINERVQRV